METNIEQLLSQMTLEEKVSLLAGADLWHTVPVKRLGIPAIKVSDGPNGVRGEGGVLAVPSACFPVGVALGATWNPELVERVGKALAEEVKAKGAHILLAPTVNIHRSPLAGRNFECYSEDPYLTGTMATAYIKGLQGNGVGACIKHFVCNDAEYQRTTMSSEVSERALREIYLVPFQMAVRDAKPWSVMSSYNKINGVSASENPYTLLDILKGEWGFDGLVMSDWGGTYSANAAAGGLDLEMPGPAHWMGEPVLKLVQSGELSEAVIDDKVRRLLRTIQRVGAFEHPEVQPERSVDRPEDRALISEAAGEAIVLLKNTGVLPVDLSHVKSIAVIGENARWAQVQGGGSARVSPYYVVSPLEGIRQKVGDRARVSYQVGSTSHRKLPAPDLSWVAAEDGTPGKMTLQFFDNVELAGEPALSQVTDRLQLNWWGNSVPVVSQQHFSVRLAGQFIAPETGLYTFGLESIGFSRLFMDGQLILDNWSQKAFGVEMVKQVSLTAGQSVHLVVEYKWDGNAHWRAVRLGCMLPIPADPIRAAVDLATQADVALVFAGLTGEWDTEGEDRPNMELPGDQVKLIEAVAAANPNTIVVFNSGAPVRMDWLDKIPALLQVWYGGQEAGNAIADVLFGEVNPSGKLTTTYPKRLQDTPAYINYPGENGQVFYGEGIFVGYRYYDKKEVEPLFPFGHGLSYTTFAYHNLRLDQVSYPRDAKIQVSMEVENTGSRAGKEVVQLYIRDVESSLVRPEKELKAFAKVALQPGETKTITFALGVEALSFYDPAKKAWIAEPGDFEVLVGSSARDLRLRGGFTWGVLGEAETAVVRLHTGLTLRVLLADPAGRAVLEKHFAELLHMPELEMAMAMTLEQIAPFAPQLLTPEKLAEVNVDLAET